MINQKSYLDPLRKAIGIFLGTQWFKLHVLSQHLQIILYNHNDF